MKYRNMKEKYQGLCLQLFAEGEGDDGGSAGEEELDENSEAGGEDPDEKKFSQKDVDDVVKNRLAREKRKWQREQQKSAGGTKSGGDGADDPESEDTKARKAAEVKAGNLEMKVACYEAGVTKEAVEDVAALARSYMASDENLDFEDAIEKVVKKYPQFKGGAPAKNDTDDTQKGKSWGERQTGKGKQISGVEAAFLRKNPGLKID